MEIIKIVCHKRYPEDAISNLVAVLSAIHTGERVPMPEIKDAALNAVAKLENRFGPESAAVRALIEAEEFDHVKVNFMVSDIEGEAASVYWNIHDLPASAKTDRVFWGDLLQRTDAIWQQIKKLQKVVENREKVADSKNRLKADEAVEKMVKEAKGLSDQAAKVLFEAAPSTQEMASLQKRMNDAMDHLETFQMNCLPKVTIPGEGQFWVCLSNRANAAVRELSRMDEAMKEKSKIADKVELKIAKLELACKEQISKVKACMEAGPAIGLKSKDILYAISEVDDHASELHDALVEKREAAIGPVKEYWASCVKRVSKAWAEMTGAEDELMLILDNQNQKLQAVDKLCQQGGHLLDLSGRMLHDGATVDTLRGMCDSMKELSLQIEPLRKGIANAHLNSKGDEKQFWHGQFDKCVGTEKSLHMRMTCIEEVISTKNAEAQRAQAQRGQTNRFAMRMPEICKENNRLSDLVAKAMNDEKNPASAKRQLLTEVADFYKQCIMFSNKLCGYLRNCGDSEYEAIREMLNCIAGIRRNCVTMTSDLRKALAMDKGMEKLLSAIFDAPEAKSQTKAKAEPSKVEPQFNADAEVQSLLGCADKAELLAKLKTLQEKLGA